MICLKPMLCKAAIILAITFERDAVESSTYIDARIKHLTTQKSMPRRLISTQL